MYVGWVEALRRLAPALIISGVLWYLIFKAVMSL